MSENSCTYNTLPTCACGCGQPVKPGQRWYEQGHRSRWNRRQQQAAQREYEDELIADQGHLLRRNIELSHQLEGLEQRYTDLWEDHQDCKKPMTIEQRQMVIDAFSVLGLHSGAEPEVVDAAYKA